MKADEEPSLWWYGTFGSSGVESVPFSTVFWPALLRKCRHTVASTESLSLDELRVILKYCIGNLARHADCVSKVEFDHFVARFGPLESSLKRLVDSLCSSRELVPWFHGTLSRKEAEGVLLTSSRSLDDGSFLVRFSESQPTRFTLSYLKIHATGQHKGRREMRNVLIGNSGQDGYELCDSKGKRYASIQAFIRCSAGRLKYGVISTLAQQCNEELANLRSRLDLASNSYTSFSTESLNPVASSERSSPGNRPVHQSSSLLFSKSPVIEPLPRAAFVVPSNQDDTYACGFAASVVLPPVAFTPAMSSKSHAPSAQCSAIQSRDMGSEATDYAPFMCSEIPPQVNEAHHQVPSQSSHPAPVSTQAPQASLTSRAAIPWQSVFLGNNTSQEQSPLLRAESNQDVYATPQDFAMLASTLESINVSHKDSGAPLESSMTYGSFDHLALAMPATAKPSQPKTMTHDPVNDDYGNFMDASVFGQTTPSSNQAPGASDVYGTFTMSPPRTAETAPSHSSDTYGSFAAFALEDNQDASSGLTPVTTTSSTPPFSAPAGLGFGNSPPKTQSSSHPEPEPELQTSPLDELNAGMEFYSKKRLDDALLRFIQARESARTVGDKVIEARALGNLGTVYLDKKNAAQAVACYEQCLEITRSIKDVKRERTILNNLVLALMAGEQFDAAYQYCQVQLEMTQSDVNRRKILSRMSLLRERAARAAKTATSS
ncbi:hypothetical protein PINS_up002823 [Pythium insidiosum]|nr:hypothetical protein PINS_up002823 [Pythium insidiosum]